MEIVLGRRERTSERIIVVGTATIDNTAIFDDGMASIATVTTKRKSIIYNECRTLASRKILSGFTTPYIAPKSNSPTI